MTYSATAPVKLLAGTAGAPGVTFTTDTDTGLYRPGPNEIAVAVGGVEKARFTGSGMGIGGDITLDDGAGTFVTTLQTITATANRTISLPDATGTIALVSGSSGQLIWNLAGAYVGVPGSAIGPTGDLTLSLNGAASTPPLDITGTWFTGGTSTTTKPQVLVEPAGTTSTAWSTSGTGLGVNAASGFVGRLLDLQLNGTSNFSVDSTGRVSVPLGTAALPALYPGTDTNTGIYSPGADQVAVATNGTQRLTIDANGNTHVIAVDGQLSLSKTGLRQYQFRVTGTGVNEGLAIRDESGATEIARFTQNGYLTVGGLRIKGTDTVNSIYQDAAFGLSSNNYITVGTGAAQTERLRVTSTGLVGIGTSAPDANSRLHVSASENTSDPFATDASIVISNLQNVGNNEAASLKFLLGGSINAGSISCHYDAFSAGVNSSLRFYTVYQSGFNSAAERMRIDPQGRVGIGTTTPDALLTVNGIGAFGAGAVGTPSISATGDLNTGFWFPAADTIAASTGGSERARIDSSGRLLVGTSSARLNFFSGTTTDPIKTQIEGAGVAGAEYGLLSLVANNNNANARVGANIVLARSYGTTIGSNTIVVDGTNLGNVSFQGADGSSFQESARIAAFVDGTPGATDMPGRLVFSTTADGAASPTERMRITSAGQIQAGGLGTAAAPVLSFLADPDTGVYSPGANQVAIATAGVGRLFIDASGNVGVNTTSGTSYGMNLAVVGTLGLVPSTQNIIGASVFIKSQLGTSGGEEIIRSEITSFSNGSNYGTATIFSTRNGASLGERLRVTSAGNVGIGTTAPDALLTVNGTGAFGAGAAATPSISFTGDLNTGVYSPGANQLSITTSGTQKFTIDSFDGNPIIETSYPLIRPTLDLNFAATRRLDPRVTFSRASIGTFVGSNGLIQTAASGVPRFDHNPATGESLGLLVEEARTNSFLYSEQFDNGNWVKASTNLAVTSNATTAPDGKLTADKYTEGSGLVYSFTFQSVTPITTSTSYTQSYFAKFAGRQWVFICCYLNGGGYASGAYFDIVNGVIGNVSAGVSATIVNFGDGWFKCNATATSNSTVANYNGLQMTSANGVNPILTGYTGNGTSGIYVWGAQLEAGSFPTSYIPTTGATVTRAADVASITGANFSSWYNNSSGSFLFAHKSPNTPSTSTYFYLITAGIGSTVNGYWITSLVIPVDAAGSNAWSTTGAWLTTGLAANESTKLAFGFTNGSAVTVKNGVVQETNTQNLAAVVPTTLSLASGVTSTIARLTYYPVRLPEAQLEALTAT